MKSIVVGALAGLLAVSAVALVQPGPAAADDSSAVTKSKAVGRDFIIDGEKVSVDERTVTVNVDKTTQLRGRERIKVTWSGARPSGGRSPSPFGEKGLAQEYPMVIMLCRGLDDTSAPAASRLSQQTCWTSTAQQRFRSTSERTAIWRRDLYGDEADRAQKSGIDPFPTTGCDDAPEFSAHAVPFVAADGKTYASCSSATMAPEAAVDASFPPAEQAAFTDTEGNGDAYFEVRTKAENASLGCSESVPCSLVVIPIEGISCAEGDDACQKTGRFAPGSSNFTGEGVDDAVSPLYWWAGSNWRNRISIPLSFASPPNVCDILDPRAPTGFYGSELLSQAALQWAPAYCLNKKRFKFQFNRLPDTAAFKLVEDGEAPAALVSGKRARLTQDPVAYAPTAVTGFAIGFVIDRPDNAGELQTLRLSPRLLAKLLTQSYTGSAYGAEHFGMEKNPKSINQDPEFVALNPGLDGIARESGASLLSLSTSSDVISTLTAYIARDTSAAAFIAGQADPWGMVVNPSYKGIEVPRQEWDLKDTFQPAWTTECQKQYTTPYFSQLAAPVSTMRTIAEAVLDGWPNTQTKCEYDVNTSTFKSGRVDRQGVGARFVIGVVTLGDAARLGLRTAELQTSDTTFAAPTSAGLAAAVVKAKPVKGQRGLFAMSQKDVAASPTAYPGTMVVYTAARTTGMDKSEAKRVASFIRISTSEGQRAGRGNGQLPDGYLPITKAGATAKLYAAAQSSASVIEAQKAPAKPAADQPAASAPADAPAAPVDAAPATDVAAGPAATTVTYPTSPTAATTSDASRLALPLLILLAMTMGAAAPILRRVARRGAR